MCNGLFSFPYYFVIQHFVKSNFNSALIAFVLRYSRSPDMVASEAGFVLYLIPYIGLFPLSTAMLYIFTLCRAVMIPLKCAEQSGAVIQHAASPRTLSAPVHGIVAHSATSFAQTPVHSAFLLTASCFSSIAPGGHGGEQIFTKQSRVNLISDCSLPGGLVSAPWAPSGDECSGQLDSNPIPAGPSVCTLPPHLTYHPPPLPALLGSLHTCETQLLLYFTFFFPLAVLIRFLLRSTCIVQLVSEEI